MFVVVPAMKSSPFYYGTIIIRYLHEKYNTAHEKDTICFQIQKWSKCPSRKRTERAEETYPYRNTTRFPKWSVQGRKKSENDTEIYSLTVCRSVTLWRQIGV